MSYAPSAHRAGAPLLLLPVQHKLSAVSVGEYDDGALLVRVAVARGKVIAQMGVHREGRQYLFLEEALYLLERGLLEVLCDGVPLTVQEAYALLADAQYPSKHRSESGGRALHSAALRSPLDAYIAYAHLKQRGCTVLRPSALLRPSASQPSQPPAVQRAVLAAVALVHPLFPTATGAAVHDEEEAAIHERLQARFCRAAPPPCPPASRVFALQELLDAVDLFFVWSPQQPPQRPVVFSRRQPPLPDHILIINSPTRSECDAVQRALCADFAPAVAALLESFFASSALTGRFSFASVPLLLATVHLTRVTLVSVAPTVAATVTPDDAQTRETSAEQSLPHRAGGRSTEPRASFVARAMSATSAMAP